MHKIILAFGLVLLLITGCTTHNDVAEDPVRAELLKPAPPEKAETDADKEQNTEDKNKDGVMVKMGNVTWQTMVLLGA